MTSKIQMRSNSSEDRAVSPVIGVILMVAITVILAAVIGAFVLNMGDSVQQEAQGAVMWSIDSQNDEITVSATSMARADSIEIRGDIDSAATQTVSNVGDSQTYGYDASITDADNPLDQSGTLTAVAVYTDDNGETVETVIGSKDYDFS